jgi:A/G-specific adenine glycosylase
MNFTKILERWYRKNKRDLPWRRTNDPYRIWISEIILQQTRIDQGMDYYVRFLKKFPDIHSLAAADEEEVLKIWQGLGYYSRARNLHSAAREIMAQNNGAFPRTYEAIRKLKGIGDYTSAAIASIAFGFPSPVVDGNVLRLFSRFFGIDEPIDKAKGKIAVFEKANQFINPEHPGDFNQAIMEFGALQCKPAPDCKICPLRSGCVAFQQKRVSELPVKSGKQRQRTRYFYYFFILSGRGKNRSIFLKKRTGTDIWKNLFDFPLMETNKPVSYDKLTQSKEWTDLFSGKKMNLLKESNPYRHILSHQIIVAKFYQLEVPVRTTFPYLKVALSDISKYPVPRLMEKYLEDQKK